tara:strand:+ start:2187 stop:2564 length:378 start_codon:yes stop_codon:yes gene_type:complete
VNILKITKMDSKNLFIILLGTALILSFIFRPSKGIEMYEKEIDSLRVKNQTLILTNDTLLMLNKSLNSEIQELINNIDSTKAQLNKTKITINNLENEKGKVSTYVNTLNADEIAGELSNYLNNRK